MHGTNHTVFTVTDDDLFAHYQDVLDYLVEPFSDPSALNFYILSQKVRQEVTVALSGDGADELFGGYSKHYGEFRARSKTPVNSLLKTGRPLLGALPSSRNSKFGRKVWQLQKYAQGLGLDLPERYWRWCSVQRVEEVDRMLTLSVSPSDREALRLEFLHLIHPGADMNDVLHADMRLTLVGDMLQKVDAMSMANSLEVRVPFLDHHVVEYAFGLPASYKLTQQMRKRILQDAARPLLPPMLYNRPKQGFEVPLRGWFLGPLRSYIEQDLLNRDRLEAQGIFRYEGLDRLWQTIVRGDNAKEDWTLWAVIAFQNSYQKLFGEQPVSALTG